MIEEVVRATAPDDFHFWRTHTGAEIDLPITKGGRMFGVECKRVDAPRLTPSMRIAMAELPVEQIAVIYPGTARFPLAKNITAVPLPAIAEGMASLFSRRHDADGMDPGARTAEGILERTRSLSGERAQAPPRAEP